MVNAIEASPLFVVGVDDVPGSLFDIGVGHHVIFGLGKFLPSGPGLNIDGTDLPPFSRILYAGQEASFLFFVAHGEPVFYQNDA